MTDRIHELLQVGHGDLYVGATAAIGDHASLQTWSVGHETDDTVDEVTSATRFDVASLTKSVVTATIALRLHERGTFDIDAPLERYVPSLLDSPRGAIPIRTLLTHTSGLPPYKSFPFGWESPAALQQSLYESPLGLLADPDEWFVYSDLNFVHLADAIKRTTERSLAELAHEHVFGPAEMETATMGPLDAQSGVAATRDWRWRDRRLRGEINDYIGAVMEGESGNAGLFVNLNDLISYAQTLLGDSGDLLAASTVELMRRDAIPTLDRPHGLGWRLADGSDPAPAWTAESFGHTGFTGTSLWMDPKREQFAILLTNRQLVGENTTEFATFRTRFHAIAAKTAQH